MIVDIADSNLYIKHYSLILKPQHDLQLNYWGFMRNHKQDCLCLKKKIESTLPKLIVYFKKEKLPFQLSNSAKSLLDEIKQDESDFDEILQAGKRIKNGDFDKVEFSKFKQFLKKKIPRKLKGHQVKASYHLSRIENGANFSVPGAGKTTVVLSVYEKLRLEGKVNTLFVVGPSSCFGPWRDEFNEVLDREADFRILAGGNRADRISEYYKREEILDLYLTTFNTFTNDHENVAKFLNSSSVNAFLVIDEAHYIKKISGGWSNAVLKIAKYSDYRCVLTGTPIPKSYSDLYNLFEFLWPGKYPISSREKTRLSIFEKKEDLYNSKLILESKVGPLFYRVSKSELGLKPQIFKDPEVIPMNLKERKVYEAVKKNILSYPPEDYIKNIELVERLRKGRMIRVRQCLSYTKLLSNAIEDYEEDLIKDSELRKIIINYDELEIPAKLTRLLELLKKFQEKKEKVVIWAHFIDTIKLIEKHLKSAGFYCKKIIGEIPPESAAVSDEETRDKIRNEFVKSNSGLDILLANPAACAESISLHKTCHNAIYYDLSYNGAQYLQSLDRIHRVGGSENQEAYYYFLHYENTVDPDILENLNRKKDKMLNIIEGDYNIYSLDMDEESEELDAYELLSSQQN